MSLNFRRSGEISVGKFSSESARAVVDSQLGELGLSVNALKYITKSMANKGNVTGKEFNVIIDEAERLGLFDKWKAEKIKDTVNLPDNYNNHWQ